LLDTIPIGFLKKNTPFLHKHYIRVYDVRRRLWKLMLDSHLVSVGPDGPRETYKNKQNQPSRQRPLALKPRFREILKRSRKIVPLKDFMEKTLDHPSDTTTKKDMVCRFTTIPQTARFTTSPTHLN
jgi:hypothetical protein